jgi:hypothetical protein
MFFAGIPLVAVAVLLPSDVPAQVLAFAMGIGTAVAAATGISIWMSKRR